MKKVKLLAEFLKKPNQVGTVFPSSPRLAAAMTSEIKIDEAESVAEIGPGTGAFTAEIVRKLRPGAKYFAVELNKVMYDNFKEKFPDLKIYHKDASHLLDILRTEKLHSVDVIVSGLPWAVFTASLQDKLIKALYDSLSDRGRLTTYAYFQGSFLPSGVRLKRLLKDRFRAVSTSEIIWKNIPPALVYRCTK